MRKQQFVICLAFFVAAISSRGAEAGVLGKIVRETCEAIAKTGTREALEHGARSAGKKAVMEATEAAAKRAASRAIVRYSDDAIRLTGSRSAALSLADDAAKVTAKVSPRNARRLAMMADDIERSGKTPELLKHLAENAAADQCVDFLWRNKGTIVGGAAITTLIMNPEIVAESTSRIGEAAVDATAREIIRPLTGGTMIGTWLFVVTGFFTVVAGITVWLKSRRIRRWLSWYGAVNIR